jgi:hypothetical protein
LSVALLEGVELLWIFVCLLRLLTTENLRPQFSTGHLNGFYYLKEKKKESVNDVFVEEKKRIPFIFTSPVWLYV